MNITVNKNKLIKVSFPIQQPNCSANRKQQRRSRRILKTKKRENRTSIRNDKCVWLSVENNISETVETIIFTFRTLH